MGKLLRRLRNNSRQKALKFNWIDRLENNFKFQKEWSSVKLKNMIFTGAH